MITPGFLSNEFVNGRRVRYISPVQLFVFMSLVYFFFLTITSLREFSPVETDRKALSDDLKADIVLIDDLDSTGNKESVNSRAELDSILGGTDDNSALIRFIRKASEYNDLDTQTKYEKFSKYLSYLVFLILPLFALFTYWLFHRSGRGYIESLLFSLHFHAFIFLTGIIFLIFDRLIPNPVDTVLQWFFVLLYLFVGLKRFFNYSWWSTLIRYTGLGLIYGFTLVITLLSAFIFSIID